MRLSKEMVVAISRKNRKQSILPKLIFQGRVKIKSTFLPL